jgi:hypothetical protein
MPRNPDNFFDAFMILLTKLALLLATVLCMYYLHQQLPFIAALLAFAAAFFGWLTIKLIKD